MPRPHLHRPPTPPTSALLPSATERSAQYIRKGRTSKEEEGAAGQLSLRKPALNHPEHWSMAVGAVWPAIRHREPVRRYRSPIPVGTMVTGSFCIGGKTF